MTSGEDVTGESVADLGETLRLLADRDRRRILTRLCRQDDPGAGLSVPGAVPDGGATVDPVELRHVHLPKLAAAGIVDWDREGAVVRPGPAFETVAPLVELLDGEAETLPGRWP
jgi:hypothetical protein